MDYVIEANVPIPGPCSGQKYPFSAMAVGNSFVISAEEKITLQSAIAYRKKVRGEQYTLRKDGDQYRCWRTK